MKKGRLPDAIVIEHPAHAGGHLGVTQIDDMHDPRFDFARVLDETAQVMASLGLARETIPLIVAGGINSHDTVRAAFDAGANGVQVGTPFAVTEEGDAHPHFKRVLADATPEDIVDFVSVTGLPARAVNAVARSLPAQRDAHPHQLGALKQRCPTALECLSVCGLRDGIEKFGHFCIDTRLAAAADVANGLFFRGREALPFGRAIRSVRDLLDLLLTGRATEPAANRPTFTLDEYQDKEKTLQENGNHSLGVRTMHKTIRTCVTAAAVAAAFAAMPSLSPQPRRATASTGATSRSGCARSASSRTNARAIRWARSTSG